MLLLFGFLLLRLGRDWCAAALLGVGAGILGCGDYRKVALNGDPPLPQDLLMSSHAKHLLSFISGKAPLWVSLFAAVLVLWTALSSGRV